MELNTGLSKDIMCNSLKRNTTHRITRYETSEEDATCADCRKANCSELTCSKLCANSNEVICLGTCCGNYSSSTNVPRQDRFVRQKKKTIQQIRKDRWSWDGVITDLKNIFCCGMCIELYGKAKLGWKYGNAEN